MTELKKETYQKDGLYKLLENNSETFELYDYDFLAMVVKRNSKGSFHGIQNSRTCGLIPMLPKDAEKRWYECEKELQNTKNNVKIINVSKKETASKFQHIVNSFLNFLKPCNAK